MSGAEVLAIIGVVGPVFNLSSKLVQKIRERRKEKLDQQAILQKELEKALGEGELEMRNTYHIYSAQLGDAFSRGDELSRFRVARHIVEAESMKRVLQLAWEHNADISEISKQMRRATIIPHEAKQTMEELSLRLMSRRPSYPQSPDNATFPDTPPSSFQQSISAPRLPGTPNSAPTMTTRSNTLVASPVAENAGLGLRSHFGEERNVPFINSNSFQLQSFPTTSSSDQPIDSGNRTYGSSNGHGYGHHESPHTYQHQEHEHSQFAKHPKPPQIDARQRHKALPIPPEVQRRQTMPVQRVKTPPEAASPSKVSTHRGNSFDTAGLGTSGATRRVISSDTIARNKPRSRLIGRPEKGNGFHGFCQGAWTIQSDIKKGMPVTTLPTGMVANVRILKCHKCAFRGHAYGPDKKHLFTDPTVRRSQCGIRFRFGFLAKSHQVCKESYGQGEERKDTLHGKMLAQKFGCMFCCANGFETDSFGGSESLMNHILVEHLRDVRDDTQEKLKCIIGRTAESSENFDINIPPEVLPEASIGSAETVSDDSSSRFANTEESLLDLDYDESDFRAMAKTPVLPASHSSHAVPGMFTATNPFQPQELDGKMISSVAELDIAGD